MGMLFMATGFFAMLGSIYSWGDGLLFRIQAGVNFNILVTDLVLAGPFSLVVGVALFNMHQRALVLGILACGMYLYGSVLIYVYMWQYGDFQWLLFVPATFGLLFTVYYYFWTMFQLSHRNR